MRRLMVGLFLGFASVGIVRAEEPEVVKAPRLYADFDVSQYLPPSKAKTTTIQKGAGAATPEVKVPGYLGVQFDLAITPFAVMGIDPQSPAAKSSLQVGDRIKLIDGKQFEKAQKFRDFFRDKFAGDKIDLQVERQGKVENLSITLAPTSAPLGAGGSAVRPVMGIQTDNDSKGLRVVRVTSGSAADKAGLKLDDIITKMEGVSMIPMDAFGEVMSNKKPGDKIVVSLLRGKEELSKEIVLGSADNGGPGGRNPFSWDARSSRTFRKPVYNLAVIPISFSDQAINEKIGPKAWEEALFSKGTYFTKSITGQPVYGSMNDYYHEASNGLLTVQGKVFTAVKVAQKRNDYTSSAVRTALLSEAVDLLRKRDGEKTLEGFDGIFFLYSGTTGSAQRGSLYWPHRSTFRSNNQLWDYFICPEGGERMADISTITHEFGHMLGLPDLYAKPENPGSEGVGGWCVMSQQTRGGRPQHPGAWCKEQLGWVKPTIIDPSVPQKLILAPITGTQDQCFKVLVRPDGSEYFLLENRTRTGYDKSLGGEGLLIWRFVDGKVTLEESHGITTPSGPNMYTSSVPYPTRSNNSFTPQTIPSSKPIKQGGKEVFITNIHRLPDGKITFQIGVEVF